MWWEIGYRVFFKQSTFHSGCESMNQMQRIPRSPEYVDTSGKFLSNYMYLLNFPDPDTFIIVFGLIRPGCVRYSRGNTVVKATLLR